MPEHSTTSAFSVYLCVVKSCELVESDLSIRVEDQNWHQHILVQIFDQNIERCA